MLQPIHSFFSHYLIRLILLTINLFLFGLTSYAHAAQVTVLNQAIATSSGASTGGTPNISSFNIPAGKNRALLIIAAFERDHCDLATDVCNKTYTNQGGLADNYVRPVVGTYQITARVAGSGTTLDKKNALTIGGTPSGDLRFSSMETSLKDSFGTAIPNSTLFSAESYHIALMESELESVLGGAASGTVNITLPDVNIPKSLGDDAIVMAFVLNNVEQTDSGIVRSAVAQASFLGTGTAGNYSMNVASLDAGQAPNDANDGFLVVGFSMAGLPVTNGGFNTMAGYTVLQSGVTNNSDGRFDNTEATYVTSEPDGLSVSAQFHNGVVSNFTIQSAASSTLTVGGGWAPAFTISADNADTSDAPGTYGSPTHTISGIRLGASVDADDASLASADATGDDTNGSDDENGVTMPASLTGGATASIPVSIQSASGYLNAWVDWNRDGDFGDAGEQIVSDQSVAAGTVNLSVPAPSTLSAGTSFARFRVCSGTGQCNSPTSTATSGEVEDYQVNLIAPLTCLALPVTTVGNASVLGTNEFQLTPAVNSQLGAIWGNDRVNLTAPFDYQTKVYVGNNDGGADGMTFTLQNTSSSAQGQSGRGMGSGDSEIGSGISPSLVIELDTYGNGDGGWSDPANDHLAVYLDGNGRHDAVATTLVTPVDLGNIEDGNYHDLRVSWIASTHTLEVYFDGVLRATKVVDLAASLGTNTPYWGYTASTGGFNNQHKVCNQTSPTIASNNAPTITSNGGGSTAAVSINENTTSVTTLAATDIENSPLTYSISGGADAAKFAINASTGVLTFVAAPDYENPTDAGANNVYDVQITVSDGTGIDMQDIAVTVTDVVDVYPAADSSVKFCPAPSAETPYWEWKIAWTYNSPTNTLLPSWSGAPNGQYDTAVIASAPAQVMGAGLTYSFDSNRPTILHLSGIDQATPISALANGDYIDFEFTTQASMNAAQLMNGLAHHNHAFTQPYKVTILVSTDNFATAHTILSERQVSTSTTGGSEWVQTPLDQALYLLPNTTYKARILFYAAVDANTVYWDDFHLGMGLCRDYSDAPVNNYGGASHDVPRTLTQYLGNTSPNAESSSRDGGDAGVGADGDSDDGVFIDSGMATSLQAQNLTSEQMFTVHVPVAGSGQLYAWFDWDGDGTFGNNSNELVINGMTGNSQTLSQTVIVPLTAKLGTTYARFRFSSDPAAASPTAAATNGEVEDYQVQIVLPASSIPSATAPAICTTSGASNAWTVGGGGYQTTTSQGLVVTAVSSAPSGAAWSFRSDAMNTLGDFGNTGINGVPSLLAQYLWDTTPEQGRTTNANADGQTGTLTFNFNVPVHNPEIYIDRIGGYGGSSGSTPPLLSNSARITPNSANASITFVKLGGGNHFEVTASSIQRTPNESMVWGESHAEAAADSTRYMAMGGVKVDGTYNSLSFDLAGVGVEGAGGDALEFVICADINAAPVISSDGGGTAASLSVAENQTAVTTVTATDANTTDTLTYSITGGTDATKFAIDASTGVLTFVTSPDYEAPTDTDSNNVYNVQVTVSDGQGGTDVQDIAVTVTNVAENVAPVITSNGGGSSAAVSVAENQTAVTTVTATDANTTDTLTYSITGGADAAKFTINASTGVLTFVAAPDYEAPTDVGANNVYDVQVTVSDGQGGTDVQDIAVTVTDTAENVAPIISSNGGGSSAALSVAENQTAVTTVTATDANTTDTLTYSITGGADAAKFAINASTGELTFVAAPDYEAPTDVGANNVYDIQVTVSDGQGGTDVQTIAVTVTDVAENVAPVITSNGGGASASLSVAENQTAVTTVTATDADGNPLSYSISGGADAAKFVINASTGVLTFVTAPNYEAPTDVGANNVYDVQVTVTDAGGLTDVQDIAVAITDIAENGTPAITSNGGGATAAISVPENQTAVTTVTASDINVGDTLTYSITGGADASKFAIDSSTGVLTFVATPDFEAPTDVGTDNIYDVQVTVTDNGGLTDTQDIAVTVTDVVENIAPTITSNGGTAIAATSVAENQTAATTVTATDANAGDTLTYSITGGADAAKFVIDSSTGVLTFVTAPDFEVPTDTGADNVYDVQVTVTDTGSLTDVQDIAVTVTDVVEASGVVLNVKAFLQGPFSNATVLMDDNLRLQNLIPTAHPYNKPAFGYTGTETLNTALLTTTGTNALVDWVLVELRDAATPTTIVARQAAMLQRDGDVVMADTGSNNLNFGSVAAGDYYVSLRHRNHLSVMSASPVTLSTTPTLIDFTTTATPTYGAQAQIELGTIAAMWAGDANSSNASIASGPGNDASEVLAAILSTAGNTSLNTNYVLNAYSNNDFDLNGKVIFAGPSNDINILLGDILMHPANSTYSANYVIRGRLP